MSDTQSQTIDGLVLAIAFDGKGGGREINWDEISQAPSDHPAPLWIHLDFTDPGAQHWIKNQSKVNKVDFHLIS